MSSNDAPFVGANTRTVLVLTTHIALLLVLIAPWVPFDEATAILLATVELAFLGKSLANHLGGNSITISWGDESSSNSDDKTGGRRRDDR